VQKMTLATLKGMNFNLGDVANALKLKAADSVYSGVQKVSERVSEATSGNKGAKHAGVAGMIDPLQLWGSLTQQFQQIATSAVKEATAKTAVDVTKHMATGMAKDAVKGVAQAARKRATAKRASASKAPARKSGR